MSVKSFLAKIVARKVASDIRKWSSNPIASQQKVFNYLLSKARDTDFGKKHNFSAVASYDDFKNKVPLRHYEDYVPFIERISKGEANVLWPGTPLYFCKSSGTTSGIKYIPVTLESIRCQVRCARNALLLFLHETGNSSFIDGKLIFLSGSPQLDVNKKIPVGRLSGIVNHHVPAYLRSNQLPTYETNCIEDWELKLDAIVDETIHQDMRLISGIPPWMQMYFDRLTERSGKNISSLFTNLSLIVHGGVNFEPYRRKINESIGKRIATLETYPASEGFIAYQDSQSSEDLLLILNEGIFYEFVPVSEIYSETPTRISLEDVKVGVNYAIVLNTNAGLFGYLIGDTIRFVSTRPYRIRVTGRIKHFISAFGEHVIAEEVENALKHAVEKTGAEVIEFTVAPQVSPAEGMLPHHEWFIEFSKKPADLNSFAAELNRSMCQQNIYYRDLIDGNIIQHLIVTPVPKDTFINYMRSKGKLGGQNKLPRLSNDRVLADELQSKLK